MSNILITSAGQRVSLVRAFQSELYKIDTEGKVLTVDSNPILAPACLVSDGYFRIPKVVEENYLEKLLEICIQNRIQIIVPTIDTELLILSSNLSLFQSHNIEVVISDENFIKICRDKRLSNDFFTKNNINIPKQYSKDEYKFPLFIKPYDGSLSKDTYAITSPEDLRSIHFNNDKFMFMELVDRNKYKEFTVDTYYNRNGELKCVVPRERIFVRAGEVNKAVTRYNAIVGMMFKNLNFISGARGCITFQFFMNPENDDIKAIEINPRFGGGYPLSYKAGANFPRYIINEYLLNTEVEIDDNWVRNLLMLRYDDEILVPDYVE